jgi:hypothetical protein
VSQAKASAQHDVVGRPYRSFCGLLEYQTRFAGIQVTIPMLTAPTSEQREAFHLLGVLISLTLTESDRHPGSR